jgi:hypothetical protein
MSARTVPSESSSNEQKEQVMSIAARSPFGVFSIIVLAAVGAVYLAGLERELTPFALVLVIPIAAFVSALLVGGRRSAGGLLRRAVRWRVAPRWYVLAIGIPLLGTLAIVAAGIILGQASLDEVVGAVGASALAVPLVVFLPALFEEIAWRGFGVDVMAQRGHGLIVSTLSVGIVFAAIHLPLYLPGQLYDGLPLWPSAVTLLGYSAILGWIYLGSGRSALLAGIGHAALNGFVPLTWGIDDVWVWQARAVVFGLMGIAILVLARRSMPDHVPAPAAPATPAASAGQA